MLYQFNCNNIISPTLSCPAKNPRACFIDNDPFTKGLSAVLATLRSISLSHISFMVQPAPRIINEPIPNKVSRYGSGQHPEFAAIAILQLHGQNNNQEPKR